MMRNLDLVLAFLFQVTLLGEDVKVLSLVGALLTLFSSISMGLLKLRVSRRKSFKDDHSEGGTTAGSHKVKSLESPKVELALTLLGPTDHPNEATNSIEDAD